ncbi:hypothetical protein LSAT2_031878 [Lamellibrachia satsuma]|nr:hypothetical protein LSAT2_031878 [Lamellibrachia satsuma]
MDDQHSVTTVIALRFTPWQPCPFQRHLDFSGKLPATLQLLHKDYSFRYLPVCSQDVNDTQLANPPEQKESRKILGLPQSTTPPNRPEPSTGGWSSFPLTYLNGGAAIVHQSRCTHWYHHHYRRHHATNMHLQPQKIHLLWRVSQLAVLCWEQMCRMNHASFHQSQRRSFFRDVPVYSPRVSGGIGATKPTYLRRQTGRSA